MDFWDWIKAGGAAVIGAAVMKAAEFYKGWKADRLASSLEAKKTELDKERVQLEKGRNEFTEDEAVAARVAAAQVALIESIRVQLEDTQKRLHAADLRSDDQDKKADERTRFLDAKIEDLRGQVRQARDDRDACVEESRQLRHELANVKQAALLDRERMREILHLPPVADDVDPTKESRLAPAGAAIAVATMTVEKLELAPAPKEPK